MTVAEAREHVRAGGLLPHGSTVVAMLSGGRDSVCLLDIAAALCGAGRVRALHVNYGLRTASDGDEAYCRDLCRQLGIEIEVVHASRKQGASGNLHAWARDLRYEVARKLAQEIDAPIATGHTASDQVETILYRLAASPGRRALLGMPASEGRLVRPLLGLTRSTTAAYCQERKLAWREDESNDSDTFARARVRHGLLPALEAVHPAAFANVLRTSVLLREETALLDGLVDAELAGAGRIATGRLGELPPAMQRLLVIRLAEDAAGTFVPQAGERVAEILALAERGGHGELHVGGLVSAVIESGDLRMVRIEPRQQHEPRG
ncbi:MAG TPA: tRNA lysidine(34) synthetase TilS [Solirubrobacteraceae bacterium]|jgi:tRNA(Ile)-lysidine synthase|nr:tRNA lysidine(34) synthetase TilS [Solirubrobacteraceae bacterium]